MIRVRVNKKSHKAAFTSRNKFTVILHRWWGFVDENGTRRKARCASVIDLVRSDDDVRGRRPRLFLGMPGQTTRRHPSEGERGRLSSRHSVLL